VHFGWNGTVGSWEQDADAKNCYSYDNDGNLVSIEFSNTISASPDAIGDIEIYSYDEGKIIGAEYFAMRDDGDLINLRKTIFNYNNNKLRYASKYTWHQDQWLPKDSIVYSYNENEEISKRDYYTLDWWQSEPVIFRESYEYYYKEDSSIDQIFHFEKFDTISNTFETLQITQHEKLRQDNADSYLYYFIDEDGEKSLFAHKERSFVYDEQIAYILDILETYYLKK
jgi:hypothetical protein